MFVRLTVIGHGRRRHAHRVPLPYSTETAAHILGRLVIGQTRGDGVGLIHRRQEPARFGECAASVVKPADIGL